MGLIQIWGVMYIIYISLRESVPKCANNLISGEASTTLHRSHKFVNIVYAEAYSEGGGGVV